MLSSAPGMRAAPDMSAFARPSTPLPLVYELGGGGPDRARIICASLPPTQTDWLAGLRDPVVGQALAALHGEAAEAWTVERLARHVGLSRSALVERFMEMVGQPPMQYLALWRMQLAGRPLADGRVERMDDPDVSRPPVRLHHNF